MRKIAIYGKGGIGKSTTTSNLAAALSDAGYRVLQIGCDPKADSTKNLTGGKQISSVLDALREKGEGGLKAEDVLFQGYGGVWCVEAGGADTRDWMCGQRDHHGFREVGRVGGI